MVEPKDRNVVLPFEGRGIEGVGVSNSLSDTSGFPLTFVLSVQGRGEKLLL